MAALTVQTVTNTGTEVTYAAAAGGGDTFVNDGRTYLHVKNGGGSPITVTINSQENCNYGSDHNIAVIVANGSEKIIGFFSKKRFNNTGGAVEVTYSGVTTVTVAAVKVV